MIPASPALPQAYAIPQNIMEMAGTYGLGYVRHQHDKAPLNKLRRLIITCISGGIPAALGITDMVNGTPGDGLGMVLLLLGLVIGAIGVFFSLVDLLKDVHVYVCDAGMIYQVAQENPQPFRWDQIHAVWRNVIKHYRYYGYIRRYTRTTHNYTIQRNDGYQLILNDKIADIAQLGELIISRATNHLLPAAIQAYQQGQTISFGSLSLNLQGMYNGRELLPWPQIKAVDVKNGFINVQRQGSWLHWTSQVAASTPNLSVFLGLVNYVLKPSV